MRLLSLVNGEKLLVKSVDSSRSECVTDVVLLNDESVCIRYDHIVYERCATDEEININKGIWRKI